MAEATELDPVRAEALRAATTFVSSWSGRKGAQAVIFCARGFESYLRTGAQPDFDKIAESTD
jgi:hypothetical protein